MEDFRSGKGFNPERLKQYTQTTDGLDWIVKHLHPPGNSQKPAGLPDRDCQTSAVTDYDVQHTLAPPSAGTAGNWSCAIYTLPHMEYLAVVVKWWDATPGTLYTEVIRNPRLKLTFPEEEGEALVDLMFRKRPIARSSTVRLNAPALSDQGMVYACQLRGQKQNNNGVRETGETFVAPPRSIINVGHLASNGGDVTMSSAKPYVGKARDGSYIPNGFTQPIVQYDETTTLTSKYGATTKQGYQLCFTYSQESEESFETILTPAAQRTVPYDDMSVGLHLYSGLSNTATLEMRSVLLHEVVPSFKSPWVSFQSPGATPDSMAVDNAYVIRQLMPDAFPEACNFWGALAGLASKVLPALAGWAVPKLTSWLGKKSEPAPEPAPVRKTPPPRPPPPVRAAPPPPAPAQSTRQSRSKTRKQRAASAPAKRK